MSLHFSLPSAPRPYQWSLAMRFQIFSGRGLRSGADITLVSMTATHRAVGVDYVLEAPT